MWTFVVEPILQQMGGAVTAMPLIHKASGKWSGFEFKSLGPGRKLHRTLSAQIRTDAQRMLFSVVIPRPGGDVPLLFDTIHSSASEQKRRRVWARFDGDMRLGRYHMRSKELVIQMREPHALVEFLPLAVTVRFRHERMLVAIHDELEGTGFRAATEILDPTHRISHTEIERKGGTYNPIVTFDAGWIEGDEALAITFLEIRGAKRMEATVRAFSMYAMQSGWTMDEDGTNIDCVPLPNADVAQRVATLMAKMPGVTA